MGKTIYAHGMPREGAESILLPAGLALDEEFHKPLGSHPNFSNSPNKALLIPVQILLEKLEWPDGIEPIKAVKTTRFQFKAIGQNPNAPGTREDLAKAIEHTFHLPVHNIKELLPTATHHYAWRAFTASGKPVLFIDRRIGQQHSFNLANKKLEAYLKLMEEREALLAERGTPKRKGK